MAHDIVGFKITKWLAENYRTDLYLVVVKDKSPVGDLCAEWGIPWSTQEPPYGEFDLGITAWWPDIIKEPLLSLPKNGWINTHPSYLPYCRGKHSSFWAIVEQVPYGVSLNKIGEGIDDGPVVSQRKIPITWEDTGETLYLKACKEMVDLFISTYPKIRTLDFPTTEQRVSFRGSYHHSQDLVGGKFLDTYGEDSVKDILNKIRAGTFTGRPACWFEEDGISYEVRVDIRRVK
jgi:methionyl-tRNA formyltransferase